MKRISDEDLKYLFLGEQVKIGKTLYDIKPFTLEELKKLSHPLERLTTSLKKAGITFDNWMKKKALFIGFIIKEAPEILSIASGIHVEDIAKLPAGIQLEIANKMISVNSESHAGLVKNFLALAGNLTSAINGATAIVSSFSSDITTNGET